MRTPIGATVTLRMTWTDGQGGPPMPFPPDEDIYLVFDGQRGPGAAYVVVGVRLMARSPTPDRYALRCMKVAPEDIPAGATVVRCSWHRRDRT